MKKMYNLKNRNAPHTIIKHPTFIATKKEPTIVENVGNSSIKSYPK